MVRRYEMALVAAPHVPEEDHDRQLTVFEQMIAEMGGLVHKVERWGRRKLAYSISKFHEGNYTLILYDAEPEVEREFVRRVKLSDTFLRFLSVRADHQKPPTTEEKAALEQARRDYLARAQERAAAGLAGAEETAGPPGSPLLPADGAAVDATEVGEEEEDMTLGPDGEEEA